MSLFITSVVTITTGFCDHNVFLTNNWNFRCIEEDISVLVVEQVIGAIKYVFHLNKKSEAAI